MEINENVFLEFQRNFCFQRNKDLSLLKDILIAFAVALPLVLQTRLKSEWTTHGPWFQGWDGEKKENTDD